MKAITIFSNEFEIDQEKNHYLKAVEIFNLISEKFREENILIPDEFLQQIAINKFSDQSLWHYVATQFEDKRKASRQEYQNDLFEDLKGFISGIIPGLGMVQYSFNRLEIKDSFAVVNKKILQEITDRHSYSINQQAQLELHQEHLEVVKNINALNEKMRILNKINRNGSLYFWSDLFLTTAEGNVIASNGVTY